jgi:hypothetical protein
LVVSIELVEPGFKFGKLTLQAKQVSRREAVKSFEDHGCSVPVTSHKGSQRREAVDVYRFHCSRVTIPAPKTVN